MAGKKRAKPAKRGKLKDLEAKNTKQVKGGTAGSIKWGDITLKGGTST